LHLNNSLRQLTLKLLSGRLNTRPYNRLDKEVADFKECKEELTTLYNIEYSYLGIGTLEEQDGGTHT